jgi:hypothetical protein
MDFKIKLIVAILVTMAVLLNLNCSPSVYKGPMVTGELQSDARKTSIAELESILQTEMEIPSYLPYGYTIQEAYYIFKLEDNIQMYRMVFFISGQPIKWEGNQYECQLVYEIDWNHMGLGLKMPWAEWIKSFNGRLENEDNKYILWWESKGSEGPRRSTSRLYASEKFPKNELTKIVESTFSSITE